MHEMSRLIFWEKLENVICGLCIPSMLSINALQETNFQEAFTNKCLGKENITQSSAKILILCWNTLNIGITQLLAIIFEQVNFSLNVPEGVANNVCSSLSVPVLRFVMVFSKFSTQNTRDQIVF